LFAENGPCSVNEDGTDTVPNPYSWNSNASIIYLDQPAGTGFSYGTHDTNEDTVSDDMYDFLTEFFAKYPEYNKQEFYIYGESFAGKYIPASAHKIWKNQKEQDPSKPHINFKGIGIGNGLVDVVTQVQYYADMAYNSGTAPSRVSKPVYELMKHVATPAAVAAAKACNKLGGFVTCIAAQEIYSMGLMIPYFTTGYNVYDMREECEVPPLCYDFSNIETYLNQEKVRKYLGATKRYTSCDKSVQIGLIGDFMVNSQQLIPDLLHSGIDVLIYNGDQDYICNWLGSDAWTKKLEWDGKEGFNSANPEPFEVDGKEVGKLRSFENFSFLQVYDAGHMVPMNAPEAALAMLRKFTLH